MRTRWINFQSLFSMCVVLVASMCPCLVRADSSSSKQRVTTQLADGVYEIRHPDAPDGFPQSNTTVIVGKNGVLVVDTCLLPSTAREDIAQIRKWTTKPVTHIVNTHWHFDHTLGNAAYAEAFPAVQIIAQVSTQKIIAEFNPGAVERYPTRVERFQKILQSGKEADGKSLTEAARKDYQKALDGLGPVISEMKTTRQLVPDVSFQDFLNLNLGDRLVEIKFLGRGNTAGDTVVYLPREKILCTGDLLDHPVPYFFGGLPTEQPATLRKLAAIDAAVIVPGHGDVLRDKAYIHQVVEFLDAVNDSVEKAVNLGKTQDETLEFVNTHLDVKAWRQKFAGNDIEDGEFFDESFSSLVKNSYNLLKAR